MGKQFSKEQKTDALLRLAMDNSVTKTSKATKVNARTLRRWKAEKPSPELQKELDQRRLDLAQLFAGICEEALGFIPAQLKDGNLRQLVGVAKVAAEKLQMLTDQAKPDSSQLDAEIEAEIARITGSTVIATTEPTKMLEAATADPGGGWNMN